MKHKVKYDHVTIAKHDGAFKYKATCNKPYLNSSHIGLGDTKDAAYVSLVTHMALELARIEAIIKAGDIQASA